MRSLGDHAKSSRQPPVKERKYAKADASAPAQVPLDEDILENGATHDSAVALPVDDVTPEIALHENGNGAVAEITPSEDAGEIATALVAVEFEPQPVSADEGATQAKATQEDDDTTAAKRAIIHEWENWSALHSDELDDPNVTEYFFRHLQAKRPYLLNFGDQDSYGAVRRCIAGNRK
jgi:hypothetical protein